MLYLLCTLRDQGIPLYSPFFLLSLRRTPHHLRASLSLEAGWDSSRHENMFLNRITPSKAVVYVTLTLAIEVENCEQPATFRKDLCLRLHKERQSDGMFTRLLRSGLSSTNMESAIFTMALKPVWRMGSQCARSVGDAAGRGWWEMDGAKESDDEEVR